MWHELLQPSKGIQEPESACLKTTPRRERGEDPIVKGVLQPGNSFGSELCQIALLVGVALPWDETTRSAVLG